MDSVRIAIHDSEGNFYSAGSESIVFRDISLHALLDNNSFMYSELNPTSRGQDAVVLSPLMQLHSYWMVNNNKCHLSPNLISVGPC